MRLLIITAAAAMLMGAAPPPDSYDFKGIRLGATIDELKAIKLDPAVEPGQHFACAGDPDFPASITLPPSNAKIGVVECSLVEKIGRDWLPASVKLTPELSAWMRVRAYRGRIYQIELHPDLVARFTVERSLRAKLGEPLEVSEDRVQTKTGETFPQRSLMWARGGQAVTMVAPDLQLQKMTVDYLDATASAAVDAARGAAEASDRAM